MSTLTERKHAELAGKIAALRGEFEYWHKAGSLGQSFEKHHSQIERITSRIDGLIDARLKELQGINMVDLLARTQLIEEKVLAGHLIWEFFRGRLGQRSDGYLRPFLQACDEFAWSCYEGLRQRYLETCSRLHGSDAALRIKEPPLVYLNGGWSPFAVSREKAFELDRPDMDASNGGSSWLASLEFSEVMRSLPVPLIGLPWYQVNHLPDVLVLGHEMGHVVEWDFGLTADIERGVTQSGVGENHRTAWHCWRREVFADIFGTLAGGPAFGRTLMDFLATDEDKVKQEKRMPGNWGEYPMRWLRLEIVAATLNEMEFEADGKALTAQWRYYYGEPQYQAEFRDDAKRVVAALLAGPYPTLQGHAGQPPSLKALLCFGKDALGDPRGDSLASSLKALTKQGLEKTTVQGTALEIFAGARALYDREPEIFIGSQLSSKICQMIAANIPGGTRGSAAADLDDVTARERLAGAGWLSTPTS